jgi:DNA repair protein RecO (recombination protein O)
MEFSDEAIVLSARRHGEANLVLSALTREHGRHMGLVKGGASRRQRPALEIGNRLKVVWHARLEEQLGAYTIEPLASVAGLLLDAPLKLAALASACAVADVALPEREPHADVFAATEALIAALTGETQTWPADYVRWEVALLAALGFGLDLSRCAATGTTEDLVFVSPKSGRAVSAAAGAAYRERLLPLPRFLIDPAAPAAPDDLLAGLRLTGFFLDRHAFQGEGAGAAATGDRRLEPRGRLLDRLAELRSA